MNYNIRNQGTNTWDGLFSLIGGIMGQNARQRGEAKNYQAQQDFSDQINALDYGGQETFTDLASRANPNSNYTNKTAQNKAMQGLLPTSFNQTVPTSDTLGQGLLGQPLNSQPAQANNFDFTNPLDKYSKENNPAMVTTSAPKTLQEQKRMIRSQIPKAIKQYIDKGYKIDQILPLIKQTADDKIAELKSSNQDKVINELYQGFISKEADANPNLKAMYAARLKQAGYDVTTAYKEFAPEFKFEKFDNGGTNEGYSFNPKTGKVERQVSMDKTVTPDAQLNADTRIKTTQMNNDTTRYTAGLRGSGGSGRGSKNKLSKEETWALNYESGAGLSNDESTISTLADLDNPTPSQQNQLQQALSRRDHYWKVSSGGQYGAPEQQEQSQGGNNDGAVWYDQTWQGIKAQNPGMSDQQVSEYMTYIIQQNGG